MKVKELLKTTEFNDVAEHIKLHYGDEHISEFNKLYSRLKNSNECIECEKMSVIINAYSFDSDDEPKWTDVFDENDSSLHFDVSAIKENEDILYSISAVDKLKFLEYSICDETLALFSGAAILAHCLWEITSYSFE